MSQMYLSRRKTADGASRPALAKGGQTASASGASLWGGGMGAQLDEDMQARFRQHFADNQIPSAEKEADRLSSGIRNALTPEAVKARMGEAMGADFSSVRFHTGSVDAARTDAMGAQAYTTGHDVYFGQRGFDPGVAAHELVHTVQQGAVDSAVSTVAAPAGGVQMKKKRADRPSQDREQEPSIESSGQLAPESEPEEGLALGQDLQEMAEESAALQEGSGQQDRAEESTDQQESAVPAQEAQELQAAVEEEAVQEAQETHAPQEAAQQVKPAGFFSRLGSKIKTGFRWGINTAMNAVTKKYESFKRKHDRAMDNLALNREDFDKMSMLDKLKWMKNNPMGAVALARQSRLGGMFAHASDIQNMVIDQLQTTRNPFKIAKAVFQRSSAWSDEQKKQARQNAERRQNFMSGLVDEARSFLVECEAQNAPSAQTGAGGESQEEELPLGEDLQRLFGEYEKPKEEEMPMGRDMRVLFGDEEGSLGPEEQLPDQDTQEESGSGIDPVDIIGKARELNEAAGTFGMDENIGEIIGGVLDTAESGADASEKRKRGDTVGTVEGAFQTTGNISSTSASIIDKVSSMDGISGHAKDILGEASSGLGIVTQGMTLAGSATNFVGSSIARTKMSKRLSRMNNPEAADKQRERFRTLNQAYKMSKVDQAQSGTGAVSSMLGIASSILKMSGVGVPVAKLLDYAKKGVDFIGGAIAGSMGKQTRSDVVNEETDADAKIQAFKMWYKQRHNEELDDHDAKHAVLKAMGFDSGKRKEIFLSISKDRAHRMTQDANGGDMESAGIVNDMGLKKGANGQFNEKAAAEKLGGGRDVDEELEQVRKSRAFGF